MLLSEYIKSKDIPLTPATEKRTKVIVERNAVDLLDFVYKVSWKPDVTR